MVPIPGRNMSDRLRHELERGVLRARNGVRMVTGLKHTDVGLSPKDVVWSHGRTELWRYRSSQVRRRPPLLIVYSLFNRSYILDLRPGDSVVEHLIDDGFEVYLLDWGVPDERDAANQLEDYVDVYLPVAIERVREASGSATVNVLGYCMGGVLAVLHAARHGDAAISSLTALTTPADLQQLGPMSDLMTRADLDNLLGEDGMVPPSAILMGFRSLAPLAEVTSWVNLVDRLWSEDFLTQYQAMSGWATDHVPLPGGVARQLRELTITNGLVNDRIVLGGERVRLSAIRTPFLQVLGMRDHIVPQAAAAPLIDLVGSPDKRDLRLDAGHVGLLVGRTAARSTLPTVIEFLEQRSEAIR